MIRASLDRFLSRHNLSANRLASATEGRVARGSVFAMARGETVKRVDLQTLSHVRDALEQLTGETVTVDDLLEVVPDPQPDAETDRLMLDAAAAELAERLAELEADQDPADLEAWRAAFETAALPGVYVPGQGFRPA